MDRLRLLEYERFIWESRLEMDTSELDGNGMGGKVLQAIV